MSRYFKVRFAENGRTCFVKSQGLQTLPLTGERGLIGTVVTRDGDPLDNRIEIIVGNEGDFSMIREYEEDLRYCTLVPLGKAKISRRAL